MTTCLIPMVMDHNPALPNILSSIHKYKHLLKLDPALKKLVELQAVRKREKPLPVPES